jgi:hypothetical protein
MKVVEKFYEKKKVRENGSWIFCLFIIFLFLSLSHFRVREYFVDEQKKVKSN